jgi:hypothetical protein
MAGLLERVVRREPYDTQEGKTGSVLERVWLDDGRELVLKHESPDDLIALALPDSEQRIAVLWDAGILGNLPAPLDSAIESVERDGEQVLVFMRDVGPWLIPENTMVSRVRHRHIVQTVARLHETTLDAELGGLCPLPDRYRLLSPDAVRPHLDKGFFLPPLVLRGWEHWAEAVPSDIADAVFALHGDADGLAGQLLAREAALVHGDLRLANLAETPGRLVLFDWGALTTIAPPAVEWCEYLAIDVQCVDATHDEFLDDIRAAEGTRHDPDAFLLALLGQLAFIGWNKALDLAEGDEAIRARQRSDLDWWIAKARAALELWSPV